MTMRTVLDSKKLAALGTVNEDLDARYGKIGSRERDEFDAKAKAWYMAECLRDARKASGMTQQQLADRIGKKRVAINRNSAFIVNDIRGCCKDDDAVDGHGAFVADCADGITGKNHVADGQSCAGVVE